jgi:hypothetical protein
MPASPLVTRRRLLLALVVLVLAVAAVVAVVALRSDAEPDAGSTPSASRTTTSGADAGDDADPEAGESDPSDPGSSAAPSADGDPADGDPAGGDEEPGTDGAAAPGPRETLDPAPFGAEATPEPGVTVVVPKVEKVTGEANVPGEVGGPALRFTVDLTNGTGKTLDLRTVVVNAYYGPDRTPAAPLLKPGGKAFGSEVAADGTARGVFVFNVPTEFQEQVELEIDPRIGAAIVIFTGA